MTQSVTDLTRTPTRRRWRTGGLAIAAATGVAFGVASAAPLDTAALHPDTEWVVHVDLEAFFASEFGRIASSSESSKAERQAFADKYGFDLISDFHGLTTYGTGSMPEDHQVLLLFVTDKVDGAIEMFASEIGLRWEEAGDLRLFRWTEPVAYADENSHYGTIVPTDHPGRRIVVLSETLDEIVDAVSVLDGRIKPKRFDAREVEVLKTPPGNFLLGTALNLEKLGPMPASALLRQTRRVRFDFGEYDGWLKANVEFTAKEASKVAAISQVVQGTIAFARIQIASDGETPAWFELIEGLHVSSDDERVLVSLKVRPTVAAGYMRTVFGDDYGIGFASPDDEDDDADDDQEHDDGGAHDP